MSNHKEFESHLNFVTVRMSDGALSSPVLLLFCLAFLVPLWYSLVTYLYLIKVLFLLFHLMCTSLGFLLVISVSGKCSRISCCSQAGALYFTLCALFGWICQLSHLLRHLSRQISGVPWSLFGFAYSLGVFFRWFWQWKCWPCKKYFKCWLRKSSHFGKPWCLEHSEFLLEVRLCVESLKSIYWVCSQKFSENHSSLFCVGFRLRLEGLEICAAFLTLVYV